EATLEELFRLAEVTRAYRSLADALRECVEGHEERDDVALSGGEDWKRGLRFKMGAVLETKLEEQRAALDAYVHVAQDEPSDLDAAQAVIRVGSKTMRWDAAARAVIEATRARSRLEPALLVAIEEYAEHRTSYAPGAAAFPRESGTIAGLGGGGSG